MNATHLKRVGLARTSLAKSSLSRVLRYRNDSVVLRIQKELRDKGREITLQEACTIFKKTLTFLWGSTQGQTTEPDDDADLGWHMFILHTAPYRKFCKKYFGRFIDHECPPVANKKCNSWYRCY